MPEPSVSSPAQRRLDRALDPAYLHDLASKSIEALEAMKTECVELETEISYVRRLAQARISILEAERRRRAAGGSIDELIASLATILADQHPRPAPAQAHLPQRLGPRPEIEWKRGLERLIGDSTLVRLPDLDAGELDDVTARLEELEREVSGVRRRLHDVLGVLERELVARIQAARP